MNKSRELSPWEKVIVKRIRSLIDIRCEGSQKKFVDKTGLNKGSVSQYVNGKNVPSWKNAEIIAAAFDVEVGWIMATDTIPEGTTEDITLSSKEERLILGYRASDDTTRAIVDKILLKDES